MGACAPRWASGFSGGGIGDTYSHCRLLGSPKRPAIKPQMRCLPKVTEVCNGALMTSGAAMPSGLAMAGRLAEDAIAEAEYYLFVAALGTVLLERTPVESEKMSREV